jgi:hypothetical protein
VQSRVAAIDLAPTEPHLHPRIRRGQSVDDVVMHGLDAEGDERRIPEEVDVIPALDRVNLIAPTAIAVWAKPWPPPMRCGHTGR